MIDQVEDAIKKAFQKLRGRDGDLFECPVEENAHYDSRKLHEVCINHKLANYLEEYLFSEIDNLKEIFITDIEFNREGVNFKSLQYDGQENRVRPDIIIHNRRSGAEKINFLVVECKKDSATHEEKAKDIKKIEAFLTDNRYEYEFGLQAVYSKHGITGRLFFKKNGQISHRDINE
ncbi:MAG: hypothetical protein HOC71_02245 [Candidatus Latescibacteria bacterium]|jgi:hypothetical protein|nr:hypothetical protein [Candidatus Latescibacterota bacterium]